MSSRADILATILLVGAAFGLIMGARYMEFRKDASKLLKKISSWAAFGFSIFLLVPFGGLFLIVHDSVRPCRSNQFDLFCGNKPHDVILPAIWFVGTICLSLFLLSKAAHTKEQA